MHDHILSQQTGERKPGPPAFDGFQDPRRHFTQVPDYLLDFLLPDLSGSELKILLYLIRHAFGYGRDSAAISWSRFLEGTVTQDGRRLDWGAGVRRDSLKQAIPTLVEKGLIEKERQSSEHRGHEASLYILHVQPERGKEEPSQGLSEHQGFFRLPNSTNIPNQLFDALLPHLTEGELKVLAYISRRTLGLKAESAALSYQQIAGGLSTEDGRVLDRGTGLSEATIKRALKGLEEKRCIVRERPDRPGSDAPSRYRLHFVDDARHGSKTAQGGVQEPHKGMVKSPTSGGVQKPHKGEFKNHTHETQYLNTVKHSDETKQQQPGDIPEDVVVALTSLGVTKKIARRLADDHPAAMILAQIDMIGYRDPVDPAAMLVRAVEEDWAPPPGYRTPEERETQVRDDVWSSEPVIAREGPSAWRERMLATQRVDAATDETWSRACTWIPRLARRRECPEWLSGAVMLPPRHDRVEILVRQMAHRQIAEQEYGEATEAALATVLLRRVRVGYRYSP